MTPPWEWPRNAGDTLRRTLRDKKRDTSERMAAVGLAGDLVVMNDQMAESLLAVLKDASEPEHLRAAAAIALGPALEQTNAEGFDDDDIYSDPPVTKSVFETMQHTLRDIFFDETAPKIVRRRALEAAVRATDEWHADAIRTAYSGDKDWVLTAAFCMQYVPGFHAEILNLLQNPDPDIRYEAVSAAGSQEVEDAWPHVAALLKQPVTDKPLFLAAIEAAGTIGGDEAKFMLFDLAESEDEEIAETADEALAMKRYASAPYDDEDEDDEEDEEEEDETSQR
jgi:HEAT repeat protein